MPPAVRDELHIGSSRLGSERFEAALKAGRIRVRRVQDAGFVQKLRSSLDQGESEAIALAVQESAERLLIDEREGRQIAQKYDLQVTGLLGILLRAKQEGHVEKMKPLMTALREEAGFWISDALWRDVLQRVGEQ